MTDAQKLKRLYILLRWYDGFAAARSEELLDDDIRLMLELEKEMIELQKKANEPKKSKKRKNARKKHIH